MFTGGERPHTSAGTTRFPSILSGVGNSEKARPKSRQIRRFGSKGLQRKKKGGSRRAKVRSKNSNSIPRRRRKHGGQGSQWGVEDDGNQSDDEKRSAWDAAQMLLAVESEGESKAYDDDSFQCCAERETRSLLKIRSLDRGQRPYRSRERQKRVLPALPFPLHLLTMSYDFHSALQKMSHGIADFSDLLTLREDKSRDDKDRENDRKGDSKDVSKDDSKDDREDDSKDDRKDDSKDDSTDDSKYDGKDVGSDNSGTRLHQRDHGDGYRSRNSKKPVRRRLMLLLDRSHTIGHLCNTLDLSPWAITESNLRDVQTALMTFSDQQRSLVRSLVLNCCNVADGSLSTRTITSLLRTLPYVTTLNLSHCSSVTDEAAAVISDVCRDLVDLDCSGCRNLGDEGVYHFSLGLPRLASLTLSACHRVGDEGLLALSKGRCSAKSLKRLHVAQLRRVTDKSIRFVVQHCKELASLDISYCLHVCGRAFLLPSLKSTVSVNIRWVGGGGKHKRMVLGVDEVVVWH